MTKANVNEGGLIHEIIPVGMLQCNCSIVGDPVTREAIVIDPGEEVGRILAALAKHRLTVKAIVSTHAHIDHVGGLKKLHDATGAPVLMNEGDLEMYRAMDEQAQFLGVAPPPLAKIDNLLNEGDTIRWGNYEARVLHTKGKGSASCFQMLLQNQLRVRIKSMETRRRRGFSPATRYSRARSDERIC